MENYEELLDKAFSKIPEQSISKERFEVPKVTGHIEGNKTIISNFIQICDALRREPSHLLKYIQRELATPAIIEGPRLILGRKISANIINQKIALYVNDFVLCSECKRPDTQLIKEGKIYQVKCLACGAKHPVKAKI